VRKSLVAQLAVKANEPADLSAFERMKDLTRRVVRVPKAEVDAQDAIERRAKAKKPA
jgi:hypothetical protein